MRLRRSRPPACDAPRCSRPAAVSVSMLDDRAHSCPLHISTFESRWGQVFVKGLSR